MKQKQSRLAQLKITDFSNQGHGQGTYLRQDGQNVKVEVPFSIPGDDVLVELHKKKREYFGKPLEWTHLAEDRVAPLCQHFGSCGGCRWQQISYERQLSLKEAWVRSCLEPYLHPGVQWHPIIPCTPPWKYRNKMELSFSSDKAGERYLGLVLYGTRGHVFPMKECSIAPDWMSLTASVVLKWWTESGLEAYKGMKDTGALRTLTLREGVRTGDRLVMLTVSGNPDYAIPKEQLHRFISCLREAVEPENSEQKLSIFIRIQQIARGKPTQFYEMLLYGPDHIREIIHLNTKEGTQRSIEFCISPSAFFQPNTRQAEQLYSRAIQLTQVSADDLVYDLYCGTGTLGICMANDVREVIGIDLSPESVCDARENIKNNQLSRISIYEGDVGKILTTFSEENRPTPDVVLVDPPRAGLDAKALSELLKLKSPKLTYISCNPVSQAANLKILIEGGYHLQAVQPVDQFPQTVHVENIVLLTL